MSAGRRRIDAVEDQSLAWLDEALAAGMSTREAHEVLARVWIPRLIQAALEEDGAPSDSDCPDSVDRGRDGV